MQALDSLFEVVANYELILMDLWGVVHDGRTLYPAARDTLERLHDQKIPVCFLSNAPRRAERVIAVLQDMGIRNSWYEAVVSSGETAFSYLESRKSLGERYFYIGPERDSGLLLGSRLMRVMRPEEADIAVVTGYEQDDSPADEKRDLLDTCIQGGIPLICTNPDKEVVRRDGTRAICAGVMAEYYEQQGGSVIYIGKPHPLVYQRCREEMGVASSARWLAVGDSIHHDILGATNEGIDSVLVSGGILKDAIEARTLRPLTFADVEAACKTEGILPRYVLEALR